MSSHQIQANLAAIKALKGYGRSPRVQQLLHENELLRKGGVKPSNRLQVLVEPMSHDPRMPEDPTQ